MRGNRAGIDEADLDALDAIDEFDIPTPGDPDEEESQRLLAEFTTPDDDSEALDDESGDVDEFALLERMPNDLRGDFVKYLKRVRASAPAQPAERRDASDETDMAEIANFLRGMNAERSAAPTSDETPESDAGTRFGVPAEFGALEPILDGIRSEQLGLVKRVEEKLNHVLARIDRSEQQARNEKFQAEFNGLRKTYKELYPKLAPRVSELLKETPSLAMTPAGVTKAFRDAHLELRLAAAESELKSARRAGIMPRAASGRIAGRTAPIGLRGGVKTPEDAARVAIRQMQKMGINVPDF